MTRRLRLSPTAESDLETIGDFIARDNPVRAVSFIDELLAKCLDICDMPQAYPEQPDLGLGVRRVVYQRYLIFYRLYANEVRIERILHGARDIPAQNFNG